MLNGQVQILSDQCMAVRYRLFSSIRQAVRSVLWGAWVSRMFSVIVMMIITLTMACMAAVADDAVSDQIKEYQIKALFLYNFANFVEWPNQAFPTVDAPLKLCLVGYVPFGGFLDTVDGTFIGKRMLAIVRADKSSHADIQSGCHILFVGTDQKTELQRLFSDINHTFVLSVGAEPRFADDWGTVNIFRVRDGAKIEINLKKAMASELTISSDLLAIARVIQ